MLRTTITKASAIRPLRAAFTTSTRAMSAGDTGATRPTGGNDAFQRREKANEDYTIRQREQEKLAELREKLNEQRRHLDRLSEHIDEVTRNQGGEKN